MADRLLMVSWTGVVPGREAHAIEVFNETVGMYGRMQERGRIESFDVRLLEPNGAINGYMEVLGSAEQLAALRTDDEFRRSIVDAELVCAGLNMSEGVCNEGVAHEMQLYADAVGKVPQAV
jgi:hypothetical protein